jgi:hypothetical protein
MLRKAKESGKAVNSFERSAEKSSTGRMMLIDHMTQPQS